MNKIIKELKEALNTNTETKAYDTQAEVVRVEGQTLWVHIPGGVDETPVKKTINAKAGDTVQVRVGGGSAWLVGNQSAPPTDDTTAIIADRKASEVRGIAIEAQEVADDAFATADSAMRSANGKNTIYYGASAPTGGTYKTGDTWFNSSEDNAIYMWNGSAWVKEELGEDAIANLSITNAKIANGTIQNGKIANLDAGKISAGNLSAAVMKTNAVSAINATVDKIDAKNINASQITIGQSQVTNLTTDLASKADTSDIPTNVSDLTNDSGYQTSSEVDTAINNAKQIKTDSASGSIATFTGSKYPAVSVVTDIEPKQSGSGTPSPSNIRPITGWTECEVDVSGVNVWDEEWETGVYDARGSKANNSNRIRSKNKITVKANTTYTIVKPIGYVFAVCEYDATQTFIKRVFTTASQKASSSYQYTTNTNTAYLAFYVGDNTLPISVYGNDISINYPSTDTTYHAYNGATYTTSLGHTVYGGTLDVTSGTLTVDRAMTTIGALTVGKTNDYFYMTISDKKAGNTNLISDYYATTASVTVAGMADGEIKGNASSPNVYIKDSNYTDATAFKNARANVEIVYELATPQTYSVSPQQVELLQGTNNLWTDCGDVNVTYAIISADAVEALNNPIDGASKVATSYITQIDNGGIKVHDAVDTSNYSKIDSNGMTVFQNNTDVATFGVTSRIGTSTGNRFELAPTGLDMYLSGEANPSFSLKKSYGIAELLLKGSYCDVALGDETAWISTGNLSLYMDSESDDERIGLRTSGSSVFVYDDSVRTEHLGPQVTSTDGSDGYFLGWSTHRWRSVLTYNAPNYVSDRKHKDIIGDLDFAKELIMGLKPVEFQWKNSDRHKRSHMGLIAQDAFKLCKDIGKDLSFYEAHYKDGSDYHGEEVDDENLDWGMMYDELIAPLIKVVQQQQKEIDELKSIVAELAKEKK